MKKILTLVSIIIYFGINTTFGYEYFENISGYSGKILKISKNDEYKVIVSVSEKGENLKNLVEKVGGVAGVNGAYFCPKDYGECNGIDFTNSDRISNGVISSKFNNTGVRHIFGFSEDGTAIIHSSPDIHPDNFEGIYNGISNFPLLLKEGKSNLDGYGNLIDDKMKALGTKNFICSTESGDVFMGHFYNQTIYSVVDVLKSIGCYNALNLDSGGSLSLYNNGYKKGPGRNIMDAFVIVKKDKIDFKEKKVTNKKISNKTYSDYDNVYNSGIINNEIIEQDLVENEENIFDKMSEKYNQFNNEIDKIKEKINNFIETIKSFFDKIRLYYEKVINFFN